MTYEEFKQINTNKMNTKHKKEKKAKDTNSTNPLKNKNGQYTKFPVYNLWPGLDGEMAGKLLSFTVDQNKIWIAFLEGNLEIGMKSLKIHLSFDLVNNLLEVFLNCKGYK